jgi:hypothetical protein
LPAENSKVWKSSIVGGLRPVQEILLMLGAKIAMWTGAIVTFLGTNIPTHIFYWLGIRPFPDNEVNDFAITLGLCILTGGVVAYSYEKDKNSKR